MALVLKDRVRETSTTTGTGTFTLAGAVAGFQSFSAIGTGNSTYYTIVSTSDWEVGIGTWTSPNQLSRDTVLASTNAGALVTFGSGTKDVFLTFPAEGFAVPPAIGGTTPNTITGTTVTVNTQIALPSTTNTYPSTGRIYMADGGDGYDYLNIDTYDYVNDAGLQVKSPYGFIAGGTTIFDVGGSTPTVSTQNVACNYSGSIFFYNSTNSSSVRITANSSLAAGYTLTLPTTSGSANQLLTTDGSGNLSWNNPLTLNGTTDPTAPTGTDTKLYSKSFGGYSTLAARNALNTSFGLQSALWSKNFQIWTTTNAINGLWLNASGTGSGTYTNVNPTAGATKYQSCRRSTYANLITTTNQLLGVANGQASFFRGSTAGLGGFFYYARVGFDVWTNGGRFFAGMATGTTVVTAGDPSALNNTVGFCVDAADNGAISFLTRGTAATKASTGLTIVSNKGYDCYIYCSPNSSQYTWQIIDINTGTSASGTATLNLPTNTTMQAPEALASNAALTPATSISIGVCKVYVESDN